MPLITDVINYLERFAPASNAANWDNVGLLAGDPNCAAVRVMTCLTITPDVVEEAINEQVQLIVAHHPIMFRGVKRLTPDTADGRILLPLLRQGIAVYSPHTAFDNCRGGINDGLAQQLGLQSVQPLRPSDGPKSFKLVVFVPDSDLANVSDAVFAAGAGIIGQYEQCSYRLAGSGTFFGTDSTNPTIGQKGRREEVSEWRFEVIVPERSVERVLQAMRKAHSYEEPAFDLYPLRPQPGVGEGRIGILSEPAPFREFTRKVKDKLRVQSMQIIGDLEKTIVRVAWACGAAGEFLTDAIRAKADLFITGEMRFHDCLAARSAGINVILPGHYATERPGVEDLAERLANEFRDISVWASRSEQDPISQL